MNTSDTENTDAPRPFGYWLTAVDRLMAAEFDAAFEGEHASRRDWRLLTVIDGTAPARRPLNRRKLAGLIERGWIVADGDGESDGWTLTDAGRDAKDRLGAIVDGIRAKAADAISPDDFATTLASLEQIARAFGWDEETPLPRRRGGRGRGQGRHGFRPWGHHGFGHGFGDHRVGHGVGDRDVDHGDVDHRDFDPDRDFGPDHGGADHGRADHGFGHGFGPDRIEPDHSGPDHGFGPRSHPGHGSGRCHGHSRHARGEHPGHDGHRAARAMQHAYERGFDAGFSRGRDA